MQNVEAVRCYSRDGFNFCGELFVGTEDGVVRSSKSVPSCECVKMTVWSMLHEDCQNVFAKENIEELEIHHCELREIPKDIGKMNKLTQLTLHGLNDLISLPEEIGELTSLKELVIDGLGIESLPKRMKQLEKLTLKKLYCLKNISEEFGEMSSLKELVKNEFDIESLPKSLGGMKRLEKITLKKLSLKRLPEEVGELSCLKELKIKDLKIERLPNSIGRMKRLEKLKLMQLLLESIPEWIGELTSLKKLKISALKVQSLPDSIGDMKHLEKMTLGYLDHLKSLPKSMKKLNQLKSFKLEYVDNCVLDVEDVVVFSQLKRLIICNCKHSLSFAEPFCKMISMTVELRFVKLDMEFCHKYHTTLDEALMDNGSIVDFELPLVGSPSFCKRNKENHLRAKESVMCMMAIIRLRKIPTLMPRDMVQMIGMMLWNTRCDIEAWKAENYEKRRKC